jgi:hypothetical protein
LNAHPAIFAVERWPAAEAGFQVAKRFLCGRRVRDGNGKIGEERTQLREERYLSKEQLQRNQEKNSSFFRISWTI